MARYRKKPVEIEAHQWWRNGDHPNDYPVLMRDQKARENGGEGQVVRYYRHPYDDGERECATCGHIMHQHGWIDTAEGGHIVCPGDYIIKDERARYGHHGYYYPCKPDIFPDTYDYVGE